MAKLKASISWILTKAYGTNIPQQFKDPYYENAAGQLQIKPQLINQLTSSELYCQACSNMFSDTASQWQGHWSIIQVLSRKGIYVAEAGDAVVTETVLMQTAPFKVAAHLALIDALMKAYASEIASVERVVQAVRRFASFNASSELPSGVEEALVFWINKACTALSQRGDADIIQGESSQKVRIVSKTTPREPKTIPKMEDLMSDLGDGCSVAATISFYQPNALPVAEVCLKKCVGIADSLFNLRLIRTFCERHLVLKCFHFTYEDLLYGRENLHENVLVFVAELFFLLEASEQGEEQKENSPEDYMEVVSVASGQASAMTARSQASTAGSDCHEPLMLAKLRPAKEKINNFSKAEERGDRTPRRKVVSPTKMVKGKTSPPAGLPVIGQSASDFLADGDVGFRLTRTSREGSIGSSRSSGDFSDHESHKIHQDHKARESLKISPRHPSHLHKPLQQPPPQLVPLSSSPVSADDATTTSSSSSSPPKHGQLITDHLPKQQAVAETQKKPGTTSFAEIRRLKGLGSVDNSGVVYMQHGQDQGGGDASGHQNRLTLKSAFLQKQDSGKKATFAQLPNETTWQQNAQRSAAQGPSTSSPGEAAASNGEAGAERPATSELSQLRMKLEEKRREIERKKQRQEVQHAKMRQRLGKAAFMRVISKQDPAMVDMTRDLEMQKKKERLIQQQLRRKEEQERRRLEKEMEAARKQEQKMMKEEEMERKKAEEKARREAIFQQYLQKKMEDEEKSPPSAAVQRRDHASRGQPRPKSMFAKARPQAPEFEGVRAGSAASHSSQEDLSVHASPPGSTAPPSPFRLKPNTRGKMRKAVSCNTLTQNGNQGASTYRRPPSPGPKLFVKPSAKSNRHIIINAISHCCLAGCVNTDMKNKVLEEIARSAAKHFLILFRDHGCQYRGLYSFDPDGDEAYKIIGTGPRQIASNMVERFYK
nr:hypothetical protein BaRGS_020657 [Batillaria attramentaria]